MSDIVRTSPAKINLFLEIKGKRNDGYHELVSWMHTVDLADSVTIGKSDLDICTLRSDDTTIPFGKRNLCIKAYDAFKSKVNNLGTVVISLDKNIPLGSGLGGGSSNAATIICGLNDLFEMDMDENVLRDIGAEVGSDVPFFISGGSALATGRGIDITPLTPLPEPLWIVIVKPGTAVSTGDAYKWVKGYHGNKELDIEELNRKCSEGDVQYVYDSLHNSFEPYIFEKYPEISEIKKRLLGEGCVAAQMTGSGAAVFGICENKKKARDVESALAEWPAAHFVKSCRMI